MAAAKKNILIVFAHPEKLSFNAALLDMAITTLKGQGHTVVVSDLYQMKYNPVVSRNDFKVLPHPPPDHISYPASCNEAHSKDQLADDIVVEQTKVKNADLIIFQFPMWWGSMPAIMKGWVDRVLCCGFAFGPKEMFDYGRLKGKKSMLSFTTGSPPGFFTDHAPVGDMNVYLWPMQNAVLRFVGLDVLAPQVNYGVSLPACLQSDRQTKLTAWQKRLQDIFNEPSIYFVPLSQFTPLDGSNPLNGLTLEDRKTADGIISDEGYNIGQHQGKKVPSNSMIQAAESAD